MNEKKFMVLIVEYDEKSEKVVKSVVDDMTKNISAQSGKAECVYEGAEEKYTLAVKKILNLAE